MFKRIFLILMIITAASCGSKRPVASANSRRPVVARKPVARKPVPRPAAGHDGRSGQAGAYESAKEDGKSRGNSEVYSKTEILQATTQVKVTTAVVLDYIDRYKDIAENNMRQYGIPASIILGQGILESGAGTGPLSVLANNHFGIKCHNDWTGASVSYDDDQAQECFRKYDQASESYRDHALFLTTRDRYAFLFNLDKRDYQGWARGLKAAGYATDPKYPVKLIGIIERYQLDRYDAEVAGDEFVPLNTTPITQTQPQLTQADNTYQVVAGDTLYSISRRFNMTVDELRRLNGMSDNALSIGQYLRIK